MHDTRGPLVQVIGIQVSIILPAQGDDGLAAEDVTDLLQRAVQEKFSTPRFYWYLSFW